VRAFPTYENFLIRIGVSVVAIYTALLIYNALSFVSRMRFGKTRIIDEKTVHLESYNSRLVDIVVVIVLILLTLYALIKIWHFDSMLEATGLFGFAFAFLALTNAIWAPDLYHGMVILSSNMLDDGDTIRMKGNDAYYIIFKVTFVYTILLDLENNHRSLIRNSRLSDAHIENLSKRASPEGLREQIVFNIGYPEITEDDPDQRRVHVRELKAKVDGMFKAVNQAAIEHQSAAINENIPFEWTLVKTGDFSLEYALYYYLNPLPNTRTTRTIRNCLFATRYRITELAYQYSVEHDIDLATPILFNQRGERRETLEGVQPAN